MPASAHLLNFLKSRLPNFRDGNDMLVVQRLGGYARDNFYSEILCLAHYCRSKCGLARSAKALRLRFSIDKRKPHWQSS